jgi:hypothetical protein
MHDSEPALKDSNILMKCTSSLWNGFFFTGPQIPELQAVQVCQEHQTRYAFRNVLSV